MLSTQPAVALKTIQQLIKQHKNLPDIELKSEIFHTAGLCFHEVRKFEDALHWYNQALELRRSSSNKVNEAKTLNNIGLIYYDMGKYPEAISFFKETIELKTRLKEFKSLTATYQNLGGTYEKLFEFKKAIEVYFKSLKISEDLGDNLRSAQTYQNIGIIYQSRNDHNKALEWYKKARKLFEGRDSKRDIIHLNNNIAGALLNLKKHKEALKYYQQSLQMSQDIHYVPGILAGMGNTGTTLKLLGRLDEALEISEQALVLANQEKALIDGSNALITMGEIYLLLKNENKAVEYLQKALFITRKLKAQNNIASVCLQLSRLYEKLKLPATALDYYKQYDKAKSALANTEISNRISQLQTKYELSKKEEELLKSRAMQMESELKALRAQMDPHFIFNSLNTMRKELLEGNIDKADQYIVRFSRLLRLILDTTRTPSVKLSDNIELLNLYVQIEQSRQSKSFSYRINIAPGISTDNIYIPGMILQPLVENAIVHGLFPKQDGNGKLYVGFSKSGKSLKIKVTDNGVGRGHSNAVRAVSHKSHATSIIRETLALAWKDKMKESYFSIKDRVNVTGEPIGTEVSVLLPFAYS